MIFAQPSHTSVYSLQTSDFMELEHALSAWDHRYSQIGRGPFRGGLLHTQTGSLGIFRNRWERTIHYQGVAPEGTIAIAISLVQTEEARWMGQRVSYDELILQRSGMAAEYISAALWDSVVFTIPEAELARHIADISPYDPWEIIVHGSVRLAPEIAARLRQAATGYLDAAAKSLALPELTSTLPELANRLAKMMAGALVSSNPLNAEKVTVNRQRRLITSTEEWVAQHSDQPLQIQELCRELDVSQRTLRYAFQRFAGMSPLNYLKIQRLNRAHRFLHDATPTNTKVRHVATANGFTHLGQFSHDYRQLFGELPSETLGSH